MTKTTDPVVLKVKRPDEALFRSSESMLGHARSWEITTPETAIQAGGDLKAVKTLAKQVNSKRLAITKPLNDALKEVNALFRPAQISLTNAEELLKSKILAYQNDQDRFARALQAKADATARKEQEKLEKRAAKAEAKGKTEKAEVLRQVAEAQTAPVIQSAAPKLAGVARRVTWKAEVTDKLALIMHIVEERRDLMRLIKIDQAALNAEARHLKEKLNLDGVEVSEETSIAARAH